MIIIAVLDTFLETTTIINLLSLKYQLYYISRHQELKIFMTAKSYYVFIIMVTIFPLAVPIAVSDC